MASRVQALPVADFTGGLNLRRDPFMLAANESPDMLNVEIDPRGGIRSRDGWLRWSATPVSLGSWTPKKMDVFSPSGLDQHVMLAVSNTILYSPGTGTWTNMTLSGSAITANGPSGADFAAWGDTLYVARGRANTGVSWTAAGAAATALTASGPTFQNNYLSPVGGYMPKADFAAVHAGYLFVASTVEDGVTNRNRLRWSHANSPENWHADDVIDILDGGDAITAIVPFGDHLLIFKSSSIWALYGSEGSSWQLVNITRELGAVSPQMVARSESAVYFFSWPFGLFRYTSAGISDLFAAIRPAFADDYVSAAAVLSGKAFVNVVGRRVWLSLPYSEGSAAEQPTVAFVFDPHVSETGAWVKHQSSDGFGVGPGCEMINVAGDQLHLAAHPTEKYVLRLDEDNQLVDTVADAVAFTSHYVTPWLNAEVPTQKKLWRRPDVIARRTGVAHRLLFDVSTDYSEAYVRRQFAVDVDAMGGSVWGDFDWGDGVYGTTADSNTIERGGAMGTARAIQLLLHGDPGKYWSVNAFILKYIPRRFR